MIVTTDNTATSNNTETFLKSIVTARKHFFKNRDDLQYLCIEDFILKEGKAFKPKPLPDKYEPGEIKQCFRNAFLLSLGHMELTYVEGYAFCENLIPVHHAWCVDPDGNVVDPTWRDTGIEYIGVPFSQKYAMSLIQKKGCYGILDMNKDLLKGKLPKGAIQKDF